MYIHTQVSFHMASKEEVVGLIGRRQLDCRYVQFTGNLPISLLFAHPNMYPLRNGYQIAEFLTINVHINLKWLQCIYCIFLLVFARAVHGYAGAAIVMLTNCLIIHNLL